MSFNPIPEFFGNMTEAMTPKVTATITYDHEIVTRMIAEAVAAEREACAQIAFNAKTYIQAATAIRARGQQ